MTDGKLAICLWFDRQAEEAAKFYCDILPDSHIHKIERAPDDWPGGKAGDVLTVDFTLVGLPALGLNGGSSTQFTDAVSLQVFSDTQEETDRYWDALLVGGGEPMMCSWLKDRYGMRWQIVPRVLMKGLHHEDAAVRARVFAAMGEMVKIDHAAIEAAIGGINAMNELSVTRYIAASLETVWDAMANRQEEWWCPRPWSTEIIEQDRRPGGRSAMVMRGPDGEEMPQEGIFLAWDEGKRFVTTDAVTSAFEPADPFMIGIWQIEPEGEGTRYTAAARHWSQEAYEQHKEMGFEAGWSACADQLTALCEQAT